MVIAAVKKDQDDEEEVEPALEELHDLSNQLANIQRALQQDKGRPHASHLPEISTLAVGGGDEGHAREDIRVHTSVLLARCPYFSAMVSSGMMGGGNDGSVDEAGASNSTRAGEFRLPCLSPQGVRAVVRWLYSARLPLSPSSLLDVVHAAKFLQVPGVEVCCARYVQRHAAELDPGAALSLLDSAQALVSQALEEAVEAYIAANMQEVMRCVSVRDQYAQVSGRQLLALLRRSDLAVPEEGLFHWLASWSRARQHWDGGELQLVAEEAAEVFDHVSYAAMPRNTLRTLASAPSSPPTPSDGPETLTLPKAVSRDWLVEALQCHSSPELLPSLPERQRVRVPSVPLLIQGWSGVRSGQMLDCELRGGACWHGPVLDLTATYSYAEIADPRGALAATRCFHVEAWVCPSFSDDENEEIYDGHDSDAYSSPVISRHGHNTGWELRLGPNRAVLVVTLVDNSEDTTTDPHPWYEVVIAEGEVEPGKWVHVAGRYDGQYLEVYLNGRRSTRRWFPAWGNQYGLQDPRCAKPVHDEGGIVNLGRNPSWKDRKLVCKLTGVRVMTDSIPQAPDGFLPLDLGEPLELGQ